MKNYSTYLIMAGLALLAACNNKQETSTLKSALEGQFLIGTALNVEQISENDTAGVAVIRKHFDAIVAENCMKSAEIQPEEGVFNFEIADRFVNFGEKHGMSIIGHTLIWHSQLPAWFTVDEDGNDASPEVLKARMRNHIHTVVSRYKGRIKGWDVVNEAIEDDGSYRKSKFYQILGEEYISLAFRYAQEADPDVELYYNDFNEWHPGKRDAIVKLIRGLKEQGIRIDAVGMQGHIGMDYPSLSEYQAAIDAYAGAGVKVMVTELDLSALPNPRQNVGANISDIEAYRAEMNPYPDGLPAEVADAWNKRMGSFFDLFLKNSDKISRVTLWGVSDGDSWRNDFPMRGRTDYPLLFDRTHEPKPVVDEIIHSTQVFGVHK